MGKEILRGIDLQLSLSCVMAKRKRINGAKKSQKATIEAGARTKTTNRRQPWISRQEAHHDYNRCIVVLCAKENSFKKKIEEENGCLVWARPTL